VATALRRIQLRPSPRLGHQITSDAPAGVTSTFNGAAFALPAKAIAIASARSGDGKPRFRMSSFDSILIRPGESIPDLSDLALTRPPKFTETTRRPANRIPDVRVLWRVEQISQCLPDKRGGEGQEVTALALSRLVVGSSLGRPSFIRADFSGCALMKSRSMS
jgi:hypothetical protein